MADDPKTFHDYKSIIAMEGQTDWIRCVVFSPNGRYLASASDDKTIQLFDVQARPRPRLLKKITGHTDYVSYVAFSPNTQLLVSASRDKTMRLWSVPSGDHIATLEGHTDWIHGVAFAPDGSTFASASVDNTMRLWDATSHTQLESYRPGIIYTVAYSPDGMHLACGSTHSVHIWDIASKVELAVLRGHSKPLNCVIYSPDGTLIASGSDDKTIKIWDAASYAQIASMDGHTDWVRTLAFTPDGQVLVSGSDDGSARLWSVREKRAIKTLVSSQALSVGLTHDGTRLAIGGRTGQVSIWNRTDQTVVMPPAPPIVAVQPVTPAPEPPESPESPQSPAEEVQDDAPITTTTSGPVEYSASILANNDISALVKLTDNHRIGSGGFGDLFLGEHRTHGKVALKRPHVLLAGATLRRFLREVELWCSMSHRYILPCLGTCKLGREVYMVSPYVSKGDLSSCIQRGLELKRSKILYEVAEALAHLHHRGIVHGDIKAQNILIGDDNSPLLCDFGLAKAFDSMVTSTEAKGSGSLRWMPPELYNGESRSMASDVYSFGITIAEILSGRIPFDSLTDNVAVMVHILIKNGRPDKDPLTSPEGESYDLLWDAAEKCWATEPKDRPYMAQVLGMLFPANR